MPFSGGMRERGDELRPVTVADVTEHIRVTCALPSAGPTVGAEVEWLVIDLADPTVRPSVRTLERTLADLSFPGGSRVSFEPGGQVELSSVPARTPDEAHSYLLADLAVLRPALRARGFDLVTGAHDRSRPPVRVSDSRRYEAMERWFVAEGWPAAREMMCNTASIQVNVGCGPDPSVTWQRANALAPLLAAMFARSSHDGWASSRLRTWAALDPTRTSSAAAAGDPIADWTEYALAARVIMREPTDGDFEPVRGRVTLREWIESPPLTWPPVTMRDVEVHLTTLFPPVRLKAWIEIRVIDMPADGSWAVPLAVTAALLAPALPGTPEAGFEWLEPVNGITWEEAGRSGLDCPPLARAADQSLEVALRILEEQGSVLVPDVRRFRVERVSPRLATIAPVKARPVS